MSVRGIYFPKNKEVNDIRRDDAICHRYKWDLFTLYRQPVKRLKQLSWVIDEENLIRKEEDEKLKNQGRK